MAHTVQNTQWTKSIIHFVEDYFVAPVVGFVNALYAASTTDFDLRAIAAKSDLELADIGLRRDHPALAVKPSHLDI